MEEGEMKANSALRPAALAIFFLGLGSISASAGGRFD
jgi:hypothetical protein